MRVIRGCVFETNSSSTHSIIMCSKEEYNKWKNGETCLRPYRKERFVTKDKALKILSEYEVNINEDYDSVDEAFRDNGIYTYDSYFDDYFDSFCEEYITPSGDAIVAFGKYGYDG